MNHREPFGGRMFGIWNVEGESGPVLMASDRDDLDRELARRQALDVDDDDHMTEYHQVFPCDIAGVWWNSYEPDPRADSPLAYDEIARIHYGGTLP